MKHIFFLFLFLFSCSNHTIIPKPKAFFYNELSVPSYVNYITDCGYSFFINSNNEIDLENCNMKIKNSSLNSTLYLSKINIQNNFQNKDKYFLKGYFKSENCRQMSPIAKILFVFNHPNTFL